MVVYSRYMTRANNTYPNWLQVTLNLSAYAGSTVQLKFANVSIGSLTGNVLVDEIRLGSCGTLELSDGDPTVGEAREAPDSLAPSSMAAPEAFDDARLPDLVSVVNQGATATWRYGGQAGQMTSNPVSNPARLLYLPLLIRRG